MFEHSCRQQTFSVGRDLYSVEELLHFGFVNIDKPAGMTSHDVVDRMRRILGFRRIGHSGTLDPAVTGSLPMGLQTATRLLGYLLADGKCYQCVMNVHEALPADRIREVLMSFVGEMEQMPPRRSRVVRRLRKRHVYDIRNIDVQEREVRFTVDCEAGTYIRTLCVDVGKALEVGAHMIGLRRTRTGPFHDDSMITLEQWNDHVLAWRKDGDDRIRDVLYPPQIAMAGIPFVTLQEEDAIAIMHGKTVELPVDAGNLNTDTVIGIENEQGQFIAIASLLVDEDVKEDEQQVTHLKPAKVFHPYKAT